MLESGLSMGKLGVGAKITRLWGDAVDAHVGAQDFRDQDRAIWLLIILHDSDPGAADSEPGTVQGVNEVALATGFWLEADAGAAGLKRFTVGAGRNFAEFVARGQPNFDVVCFGRSKAHVSSAEQHGAIVQPQFLKYGFRISCKRLVLFVAFLGMSELEKLDFLKLMLAEDAAGVLSGGASFGAEAGGPGGDKNGEFFFGNGFVAVQIVELDFGSGREPEVGVLDFEKVGGEFRELASAGEGGGVHQEGRQDFRVAVLAGVDIEEEIREGALKAGSPAFVNGKARTRDFRCSLQIQDPRARSNLPVRLRLKIKFRCHTPAPHLDILRRAVPDRYAGVRKIRNLEKHDFLLLCQFDGSEALDLDWLREGLHLSDERICIQIFFLEPSNLFAGLVPSRSERLRLRYELAAFLVERAKCVQVERGTAVLRHFRENIQMVPKVIQVMHGLRRIPYSAWP